MNCAWDTSLCIMYGTHKRIFPPALEEVLADSLKNIQNIGVEFYRTNKTKLKKSFWRSSSCDYHAHRLRLIWTFRISKSLPGMVCPQRRHRGMYMWLRHYMLPGPKLIFYMIVQYSACRFVESQRIEYSTCDTAAMQLHTPGDGLWSTTSSMRPKSFASWADRKVSRSSVRPADVIAVPIS